MGYGLIYDVQMKRYFDPTQCACCGKPTGVLNKPLRVIPIVSPRLGGTRQLSNFALVCDACRRAIFDHTADKYKSNPLPTDWNSRKATIHKEDNWECGCCERNVGPDAKPQPQTHHIRPRNRAGENRLTNLVVLCKHCHDIVTDGIDNELRAAIGVEASFNVMTRFIEVLEEAFWLYRKDFVTPRYYDYLREISRFEDELSTSTLPREVTVEAKELLTLIKRLLRHQGWKQWVKRNREHQPSFSTS